MQGGRGADTLTGEAGLDVFVFDSLDAFVPPWLKRVQARVVHLICAGVFGFLAYLMTLRADRFAEYGDTTVYLKLSIAPVAWLMAALLLLTALVHLLFVFVAPPRAPHVAPGADGAAP